MRIDEFKLERYFTKHESNAKYILGASDCETFTVSEVLSEKELSELHSLRMGYSESQGNAQLREEIATLFQNLTPDDIAVAVPQEAIFLAMNALLDPGDKIAVQVPCYQSLCAVPAAIGAKVLAWSPVTIRNQWHWDLDFLRENVDKTTKLITLNSPHNPTGYHFTQKEYAEIIDIARENGCHVFSDEMYRLLEYQEEDRLPIGSEIYEKCISLSGMSKTFGLGGLRIGWLSTRDRALLERIVEFKDYTTITNSVLSEYVALGALRKREILLSRNMNIIKNNLKLLDEFFTRHTDKFTWLNPKAGPVAFVKTKFEGNIESFCDDLISQKGVLLMPGTKFDYGHHYFRLGFGRKNLPDALGLFEEFVNEKIE